MTTEEAKALVEKKRAVMGVFKGEDGGFKIVAAVVHEEGPDYVTIGRGASADAAWLDAAARLREEGEW